jgi:hypothetical protein
MKTRTSGEEFHRMIENFKENNAAKKEVKREAIFSLDKTDIQQLRQGERIKESMGHFAIFS